MKRVVGLMICAVVLATNANAQQDTMLLVRLPNVDVKTERKWDNDKDRYQYNQTKYYVTTILPFLNAATKVFHEIDVKRNDPTISKKERKRFIDAKEDEMRNKFENEVKELNVTQGVLLIKLIARQTGVNIYSILQEFKNPLTAVKWQAWAKVNGHNLNKRYNPIEEPMLEHIMESLGYPLPPYYGNTNSEAAMN
ncbi:MAG: DUF4294 domain-containing protein [Sphingobacteriales bacterium]|nr:MAG: DUF4294 domain-containing protein [Sphingobacteriales bacterium]